MTHRQIAQAFRSHAYYHPALVPTLRERTGLGATAGQIGTGAAVGAATGFLYAGPIGAAIGAATSLIGSWVGANSQTAAQKVATTRIVNEAEPLLVQNLAAWQSSAKTRSEQAQALANFDQIWNVVVKACGNPGYGDPGSWCTDDRKAGACKWKDASGQCWNWFSGYRDPIANDSNVVPDPTPVDAVSSFFGGLFDSSPVAGTSSSGISGALLIGAGLIAAFFLMD